MKNSTNFKRSLIYAVLVSAPLLNELKPSEKRKRKKVDYIQLTTEQRTFTSLQKPFRINNTFSPSYFLPQPSIYIVYTLSCWSLFLSTTDDYPNDDYINFLAWKSDFLRKRTNKKRQKFFTKKNNKKHRNFFLSVMSLYPVDRTTFTIGNRGEYRKERILDT